MSSTATSRKPRKKKPLSTTQRTEANADIVSIDADSHSVRPGFPLVAFLWPARGTTSPWVIVPLVLMIVGLFRWTVGLWGYSGDFISNLACPSLTKARVWETATPWRL